MLRYDEDWSFLRNQDCAQDLLDRIKYIALGHEDWFLSVGGEIRYQYENYDNPGFGTDPASPNGYILQRYLLHIDWHFGSHFRLFTQFQSGLEDGRNGGPRLTDEDVADLHQAFVDVANDSHNFVLRVGRQEAEFGSGRLIGESEGLNIRRSFDGFRVIRKLRRWNWNSMLFHPVLIRPNTYAIPDQTQTLWGTGFVHPRENGGVGNLLHRPRPQESRVQRQNWEASQPDQWHANVEPRDGFRLRHRHHFSNRYVCEGLCSRGRCLQQRRRQFSESKMETAAGHALRLFERRFRSQGYESQYLQSSFS
jgi:hypothetical protein